MPCRFQVIEFDAFDLDLEPDEPLVADDAAQQAAAVDAAAAALGADLDETLHHAAAVDAAAAAVDAAAAAAGIDVDPTPRTDLVNAYGEFKTASSAEGSLQARQHVLAARERVNRLVITRSQLRPTTAEVQE